MYLVLLAHVSIEEVIGEDLWNVLQRDLLPHDCRVVCSEVVQADHPAAVLRRPTLSEVVEAGEPVAAVGVARLEGGGDEAGLVQPTEVVGPLLRVLVAPSPVAA